jgi:hypothetical protein
VGCACSANGGEDNCACVMRTRTGGKRPLGKPRRRCVHNIELNLVDIGCGGVDWTALAQNGYRWRAFVNAAMKLRFP